jgi:hypothetical protein
MRKMLPSPAKSSLIAADDATLHRIQSAEQFAIENYPRVVKALTMKAREGNLTAIELLQKEIIRPYREQAMERIERRPSPVPVNIEKALMVIRTNCGLPEPPPAEVPQVEAPTSMPKLPETVTTNAPNHTCPCGTEFWSNQPQARWCDRCKRERSMARLLASKQKRGV